MRMLFLGGYGGYIFGKDNTDPLDIGLNNEGAVKSGEFMLQRYRDELLPLKNEDITGDVILQLHSNENNLMYRISGPSDIKNHSDAGINFGVAPLPTLDNGQAPASFLELGSMLLNSYTPSIQKRQHYWLSSHQVRKC